MVIYGSAKVEWITYSTVFLMVNTCIVCYIVAVGLGHVPAWLPMISDCAVQSPEKYMFRVGVISGATCLLANMVMVYNAFPDFYFRKCTLALAVLAAVGMSICGAVDEKENPAVHDVGALLFFACYDLVVIILSLDASWSEKISPSSIRVKLAFAILAIVVPVIAIILSYYPKHRSYLALCEWFGAFGFAFFTLTFAQDFDTVDLVEEKCPDFERVLSKPNSSQCVYTQSTSQQHSTSDSTF